MSKKNSGFHGKKALVLVKFRKNAGKKTKFLGHFTFKYTLQKKQVQQHKTQGLDQLLMNIHQDAQIKSLIIPFMLVHTNNKKIR